MCLFAKVFREGPITYAVAHRDLPHVKLEEGLPLFGLQPVRCTYCGELSSAVKNTATLFEASLASDTMTCLCYVSFIGLFLLYIELLCYTELFCCTPS